MSRVARTRTSLLLKNTGTTKISPQGRKILKVIIRFSKETPSKNEYPNTQKA